MSTRSVILVTGNDRYGAKTYRLYKHSDGYPSGTLPLIAEAIASAVKEVNEQNVRFEPSKFNPGEVVRPEHLVGKLIGACSSVYGMGAELELTKEEVFKQAHLGNQWDVEYIYLINTDTKSIQVYSVQGGIQAGYLKGTIDVKSDNENDNAEVDAARLSIETSGFTIAKPGIKPKGKIPRKTKHRPSFFHRKGQVITRGGK